jgi:hypothetical protein
MPPAKQQHEPVVQYVVVKDKDMNGDGVVDHHDTVVMKMVDGVEVERVFLNPKVEKALVKQVQSNEVIANANASAKAKANARVVYKNMPRASKSDPPPVVIKEETSLGQHLKAGVGLGAGATAGNLVVEGLFNALGSLFD